MSIRKLACIMLGVLCLLLFACGEETHLSSSQNGGVAGSEFDDQSGTDSESKVLGDQSSNRQDETDHSQTLIKPPYLDGESDDDEVNSIWIESTLEPYDLVPPVDHSDEGLMGVSLCAFEPPSFVLSHPHSLLGIDEQKQFLSSDDYRIADQAYELPVATIAHLEPNRHSPSTLERQSKELPNIILPTHVNDMILFERAIDWSGERCYQIGAFQTPSDEVNLEGTLMSERDAYDMYLHLVRTTLWREIDQSPNRRTVVGLRGAYPGSLVWHHNAPNQYNDALVLLWLDEQGRAHVKEYPVNTDTGAYDFGDDMSSSLRANRHYPYTNGWHRDYHALNMDLDSYPVRNDTNNNGHWDSDRNGWLSGPENGNDYDRMGNGHNIHAGDIGGELTEVLVNIASAGCQVIPGMENWIDFISHAWTRFGDDVDYFLIDTRDISPRFWEGCELATGSHKCPHMIHNFPYEHSGDTRQSTEKWYSDYNCSAANESGAEVVYILNLPHPGTLRIRVETDDPTVDPDIYLLEGDDRRACHSRDHRLIETWIPAGRYVIVIDTWVDEEGDEKSGPYTLSVDWSPNR